MLNGPKVPLSQTTETMLRGDKYDTKLRSFESITKALSVMTAERSGRRAKPSLLLPRNGTESKLAINGWHMLQKGVIGSRDSWRPYGPHFFREQGPFEIENQYAAVARAFLLGTSDHSSTIQNKILAEIVSGKAQMAVDLVELRKTKDMFADAAVGLFHAYRDLRAGRPLHTFVREMKKTGYRSYAGRKWLEYIYGWAPTIAGAFETAEVINDHLKRGSIVTGKVRHRDIRVQQGKNAYGTETRTCKLSSKGIYEFTISDPKLLKFSQLGFSNPLSVAWELTPWSFVLDWFVDVGGYINRMDFALGLSDIWWQYSGSLRANNYIVYTASPLGYNLSVPLIVNSFAKLNHRHPPSKYLKNTFQGFKRFSNETVRLTSAVALINQQLTSIKKVR